MSPFERVPDFSGAKVIPLAEAKKAIREEERLRREAEAQADTLPPDAVASWERALADEDA